MGRAAKTDNREETNNIDQGLIGAPLRIMTMRPALLARSIDMRFGAYNEICRIVMALRCEKKLL